MIGPLRVTRARDLVGCGLSAEMPCSFATAEQYTAHWNTFHVEGAPAINCLVRLSNSTISPVSIDAFFHHVTKMHSEQGDNGHWHQLNNWVRKALVLAPNPQYWPIDQLELSRRPDQIISLKSTDRKTPFLVARWIARTKFQQLVNDHHPVDPKSQKARGGGRGTGHGRAGAKRKKAPKPSPVVHDDTRGELTTETILGWGSDSELRNECPTRGGRTRGRCS